jgi:hypothetical protein
VGPFLFVVAQVAGEISRQAVELGHETAREGRSPALFEDRPLDSLDSAIGGRTSGSDEAVAGAQVVQRVVEDGTSELGAIVGQDTFEAPAVGCQIGGDSPGQGRGPPGRWVERADVQLGPDVARGQIDGGVLPDSAARPR